MQPATKDKLSPDVERALEIYERALKPLLEPTHPGQAVAIDSETGEYAVRPTRREAAKAMRSHNPASQHVVTLTIGPPTSRDIAIGQRISGIRR